MGAQAKIINMLLYDGTLSGVIRVENSSWNAGELFSSPRESVSDLLKTGACNKYGVYLLISSDLVYVGQSSDLAKRLSQHITGKNWWERAIILTTKDDSLTHSDIDYLENILIEKAFAIKKLDCDNKKSGNPPKVDIFRRVFLGQYLDEALFLMQLIGVTVFCEKKSPKTRKKRKVISSSANTRDISLVSTKNSVDAAEFNDVQSKVIPALPDNSLKIGAFVFSAMKNLSESGYFFSDDQIELMCTSEWSKKTFHTKAPFMKKYIQGITDNKGTDGNVRFRALPLLYGNQQVLISKEWYERQRELFIDWYSALSID